MTSEDVPADLYLEINEIMLLVFWRISKEIREMREKMSSLCQSDFSTRSVFPGCTVKCSLFPTDNIVASQKFACTETKFIIASDYFLNDFMFEKDKHLKK